MEQLAPLIEYLANRPGTTIAAAVGIAAFIYLLFRKPKTVREADQRLRELKGERGGQYNKLRPPK